MAIVVDLSPAGSIASYSDLVTELRDLQDNAAYDGDAIDRAIRKAEAYFLRNLRLPEMELSVTLAVTDGTATLPADCRQVRAVVWLGPREWPVEQMTPSGLAAAYGGASASYPFAFAREGLDLRFAPSCTGTARLLYYADMLPLGDSNPTNWLLTAAPDLYIAGAQYYLCSRERDDAGAARALSEVGAIISAMKAEAADRAGGNLVPYAIAQVCGSRV